MKDITFYQSHLDRVSRSFAFCIQKLEPPFRQWVSLSYLMCRILDTIEDSTWSDSSLRESQYEEFERFLNAPTDDETIHAWRSRFPDTVSVGEGALLKDAHLIFEDLHESPASIRQAIQATVQRMSSGMKHYSSRQIDGVLHLTDLTDVNRYCYFVAGVVGELLTRLVLTFRTDFKPGPELMKNAFHFGLFLQKVNLLKDQRTDEQEGRYLIPDRAVVRASLTENAQGAIAYLVSIPLEEKGYRTFCAWSLFLGAASLAWIEKSYAAPLGSAGTKIPRSVTEDLLKDIESIVLDDEALKIAFDQHFPKLPSLPHHSKSNAARESGQAWFLQLSGNVLQTWELADLRMN